MNVSAIFQKHYEGELSGAVWIIDSASNRARFEGSTEIDQNSALFSMDNYKTLQSALPEIIWNIHDHYPDLEAVFVVGVDFETSLVKNLQDDYDIELTTGGFICKPMKRTQVRT